MKLPSAVNLKLPSNTKSITLKEVYVAFAQGLLEANPEFISTVYGMNKKGKRTRHSVPHMFIYKLVPKKRAVTLEGERVIDVMKERVDIIDYYQFREIIITLLTEARNAVCDGHVFHFGNKLGKIAGHRVELNLSMLKAKRKIDWPKTMQNEIDPNTGRRRAVYKELNEDTYCRIAWEKSHNLRNANVVTFRPSASNTGQNDPEHLGFVNQFSLNLKHNPNIQFLYRYFPLL